MQMLAGIVRYKPLFLPSLLLVFTTIYLQDALSAGKLFRYGLPGASFMPVVLSVIMYLGLGVLIVREVIAIVRTSREDVQNGGEGISLAPLCIAGATLGLILFLKSLGFLIAGTLYVFVLLSVFEGRKPVTVRALAIRAVISVVVAVIVYLFFTTFFAVNLPAGIFA